MQNFTERQLLFVDAKANGIPNRQAGLLAGYAPRTVDQAVSRLMAREDVRKAISTAKLKLRKDSSEDIDGTTPIMRSDYASPIAFMEDVMNNSRINLGLRFEAAKQLLPYKHARIGEIGRKESNAGAAAEVVTRGRFAPKAPPKYPVTVTRMHEQARGYG